MGRLRPESHSSLLPSASYSDITWPLSKMQNNPNYNYTNPPSSSSHNLELQLLTTSSTTPMATTSVSTNWVDPELHLSIGSSSSYFIERNNEVIMDHEGLSRNVSRCCTLKEKHHQPSGSVLASRVKEQAEEQLKLAVAERAYAEEARRQAKRQIELAEEEFMNAKRIRQQAQEELGKAQALRAHATKQVGSTILQITCYSCKQKFQAAATPSSSNQDNED